MVESLGAWGTSGRVVISGTRTSTPISSYGYCIGWCGRKTCQITGWSSSSNSGIAERRYWLILDRPQIDVCLFDPDSRLTLQSSPMSGLWRTFASGT